jgi:hypothetical protein
MRRPDGTLVELRVLAPFSLHQLAATGSNDSPNDSIGQLPAPAEPLLVEMTPVTVEMMVERYFPAQRGVAIGLYQRLHADAGLGVEVAACQRDQHRAYGRGERRNH